MKVSIHADGESHAMVTASDAYGAEVDDDLLRRYEAARWNLLDVQVELLCAYDFAKHKQSKAESLLVHDSVMRALQTPPPPVE